MLARPIGVFTSELAGYYFGGMLSGIHQVTRDAGVPLILIQHALRDQQFPVFSADTIAGWIVVHPVVEDRAHLALLCAGEAPVVILPAPLDGPNCTLVQFDNRGGMCAAVLHLIDHGHRRIAYVDHGPEVWSEQRFLGYCDAFDARGIAYDPELVLHPEVDTVPGKPSHAQRGQLAAQYLLEQGLPCTAVAAATDACALEMMQIVQAAGYRIPDDLAVVGFDDIVEAQYASPPLTTVRSHFDGLGRAAAGQVLAEIRDGRPAQPLILSVPTTVLARRSCGCTALDQRMAEADIVDSLPATWQTTLTRQLVHVVRYPVPLDPAVSPAQFWPGASTLVTMIDAVCSDQQPAYADLAAVWEQAIAQTENLEALHAALMLLEDAAAQRLAVTSTPHRYPAVAAVLRRIRLELMRARLAHEAAPKQELGDQIRSNTAVSMALLGGTLDDTQSLGWLDHTSATWGCLAVWDGRPAGDATTLRIAGVYHQGSTSTVAVGQQVRVAAFPPFDQLPASARLGQDLTILCPVRTQTRDWGLLALCGWANSPLTTGTENLTIQATLLGAGLERKQMEAALIDERALLARRVDERTADLSAANAELARTAVLKDAFLASMSHELRTPLNAVLGLSEALQEEVYGPLTDRQGRALHSIEESGRHLLELINDMLDLAKIGAGMLELELEPSSIATICQASVRLIAQLAHTKRLSVELTLDPTVTLLQVDARRVKQILVNLLSNAVKFTPEGGAIGLEVAGDPVRQAVDLIVWDTGVGIAQAQMPQLFQPFVQLDSRLARHYEGTGLGLALVYQMVELHGGGISVTSDVGHGSRFTVALPWPTPNEDAQTGAPPNPDVSAIDRMTMRRALVCEDSPTTAEQLTRYLSELAIASEIVRDGAQVVARATAEQPDLIILAVQLPNSSGWDVLAQLKAAPRTRTIPVVITSVIDEHARGLVHGAAACLVKPITRADLHRVLPMRTSAPRAALIAPVPRATAPTRATPPPRVLLAEDNEATISMVVAYLGTRGYQVVVARNGAEAIAQVHETRPAIVLMDIQMPGMDGLEAMRRIRSIADLVDLPIIALTALAMPGDRERCLAAGANEYLSKPISLRGLASLMETTLREHLS